MRYTLQLDQLKTLVQHGESGTLEFKKTSGQRSDAAKTICAFLNGIGGTVVFGVTDKGEVVGQEITNKTLADLAIEFRRIEPSYIS